MMKYVFIPRSFYKDPLFPDRQYEISSIDEIPSEWVKNCMAFNEIDTVTHFEAAPWIGDVYLIFAHFKDSASYPVGWVVEANNAEKT